MTSQISERGVSLVQPGDRPISYSIKTDAVVGLYLRVNPGGRKIYELRRRIDGKQRRFNIGRHPDMPFQCAIKRAASAAALIADGMDPATPAGKNTLATFGSLWQDYLATHSKKFKRTSARDVIDHDNHLAHWDTRPATSITFAEVRELHTVVGTRNGPHAANKLLALISAIYNHARIDNPAKGIRRFPVTSRERFLSHDELQRLHAALEDEKHRDFFLLALLTGARRGNLLKMRWDDIDLGTAMWLIPRTKNGTSQRIPLVDEAVEILHARALNRFFVFPSDADPLAPMSMPNVAWRRIRQRAGLKDVRFHDLRRTFGSWQVAHGASLAIVGKSLNHKSSSATQVYARLDVGPVRDSMQTAARAMFRRGKK